MTSKLMLWRNSDQSERQATAQELIDFDHHWSRLLGAKNVTGEEMDRAWKKSMKFTSGTGVVYKPNLLVEQDVDRAAKLASGITLGSVCRSLITISHSATEGCFCLHYSISPTCRSLKLPMHTGCTCKSV